MKLFGNLSILIYNGVLAVLANLKLYPTTKSLKLHLIKET